MRTFTHDAWSPLAYIPELSDVEGGRPPTAPTWVDDLDARRLTAYRVLAAYMDNVRRYWLPNTRWDRQVSNVDGLLTVSRPEAQEYREYGDPALLVDTARALILGEDQSIEIDDPRPDPQPGTELAPLPSHEWLLDWAARERLTQKLLQGEANSVGLGDGVYVLGMDPAKGRPRLRVYDPGFFFPDPHAVVDGWADDEFPPVVHLAWEYEVDGVTWVRRHTWRMTRLEAATTAPWGGAREWTCMYRVVDYRVDHLAENATVYSAEMSRSPKVVQDWSDLQVDFIPVVHVPNTPSEWGASILLRVGQILDDIANTDTDTALVGQTSAAPAFATVGSVPSLTGRPGEAVGLDAAGAGWTDTSKNLVAVTTLLSSLLDRLAVNTRLAQALLGRVQPNEVPSGYALALGFHPARQLMREARTVRDEKYPLILKFALRLAQAAGKVPPGVTPEARIVLGSSLPADLGQAISTVKDLLPVHGISIGTAVRVLVQAGLPIEDAQAEVDAIQTEMFEQAVKLVEATGDVDAARKMLGLGARGPVLPTPTLVTEPPPTEPPAEGA